MCLIKCCLINLDFLFWNHFQIYKNTLIEYIYQHSLFLEHIYFLFQILISNNKVIILHKQKYLIKLFLCNVSNLKLIRKIYHFIRYLFFCRFFFHLYKLFKYFVLLSFHYTVFFNKFTTLNKILYTCLYLKIGYFKPITLK